MRWRGAQTTILSAVALLLLGAGIKHAAAITPHDGARSRAVRASNPSAPPAHRARHIGHPARQRARRSSAPPSNAVYASVGPTPSGSPLPAGFVGLSFEYSALEAYTGAEATALDPVFLQLLRNLGRPLVVRIGGNSTDATWWPVPGMSPPPSAGYALTPRWAASARALATETGARLLLGVNLAAGSPDLTAAESNRLLQTIGAGNVAALELGNEPDVYGVFPWYRQHRRPVFARSAGYGLDAFIGEVRRSAPSLPHVPLAGPATAELPWLGAVPALRAAEPALREVTVHRYALQGCLKDRSSPAYPSVTNLLRPRSSAGLARGLAPYLARAHDYGLIFRVDELNSAALAHCLGRPGVSNTFASALWMLDVLFNLARAGVDGVNVHSLPGAGYELFTFRRGGNGWRAFVHPDYYGMLMFSQAFPAGARLLPVHTRAGRVKVWATRARDGRIRVTLINEDSRPHQVELQLPPGTQTATLSWLRAPRVTATGDVTLGGQSFGGETSTGRLAGASSAKTVSQLLGWYSIRVPAYSAGLLTG